MFRPPGLLATQVAPTAACLNGTLGSHGFFVPAYLGLSPPRAGDKLAARIGQLTAWGLSPHKIRGLAGRSPDGILAVHISSLYFDFKPLMRGLADEMNWPAVLIENQEDPDAEVFSSEWTLMTKNGELLADEDVIGAITPWLADPAQSPTEVVWTDDYSNLFRLLNR